jgi:hypothetical protein
MAGLVPAIHLFLTAACKQDVDARDKRGHDGVRDSSLSKEDWICTHLCSTSPTEPRS